MSDIADRSRFNSVVCLALTDDWDLSASSIQFYNGGHSGSADIGIPTELD